MRLKKFIQRKETSYEDVLLAQKSDRRLLSNVPDRKGERSNADRRGKTIKESDLKITDFIEEKKKGIRYHVSYQVKVSSKDKSGKNQQTNCEGIDISMTGILLKFSSKEQFEKIKDAEKVNRTEGRYRKERTAYRAGEQAGGIRLPAPVHQHPGL